MHSRTWFLSAGRAAIVAIALIPFEGCQAPLPVDTSKMTPAQKTQAKQAWGSAVKSRRLTAASKYAAAMVPGERALELTQGVVPETDPALIAGMIDLANLYFFADEYDKALALMLRAKAIMDQHEKGTGRSQVKLDGGKTILARYDGKAGRLFDHRPAEGSQGGVGDTLACGRSQHVRPDEVFLSD